MPTESPDERNELKTKIVSDLDPNKSNETVLQEVQAFKTRLDPQDDNVASAYLMAPNTDSITEVAELLLEKSKDLSVNNEENLDLVQQLSLFKEEFSRLILDWIGTGKLDELRELHSSIDYLINKSSADSAFLENITPHQKLIVMLSTLSNLLNVLFRTRNMAKYIGTLSGEGRPALMRSILSTLKTDNSYGVNNILSNLPGLAVNAEIVKDILEELIELELVEKNEDTYRITWIGSGVSDFFSS